MTEQETLGATVEADRIADRLENIASDVSLGLTRPPEVAERDVDALLRAAVILRVPVPAHQPDTSEGDE